jgi:hypothetical protein
MYIQRGVEMLVRGLAGCSNPRTRSSQWNLETGIVLSSLATEDRCLGATLATRDAHVGGGERMRCYE